MGLTINNNFNYQTQKKTKLKLKKRSWQTKQELKIEYETLMNK